MFEYDIILDLIQNGLIYAHLDINGRIVPKPVLNKGQIALLLQYQLCDFNYIFNKSFDDLYYDNLIKASLVRGAVGANTETNTEYDAAGFVDSVKKKSGNADKSLIDLYLNSETMLDKSNWEEIIKKIDSKDDQ